MKGQAAHAVRDLTRELAGLVATLSEHVERAVTDPDAQAELRLLAVRAHAVARLAERLDGD